MSDYSTHAMAIRDACEARVFPMKADPADAESADLWLTKAPNPAGTLHPHELPFVGVFMMRERMAPDGDGNAGELRFVHDATVGFSLVEKSGDAAAAERAIDAKCNRILHRLFTDPTFVRFGEGALFESVEAVERTRVFPSDGETHFVEMRMAVTFRFRSDWPPVVEGDLEIVRVTTGFPLGGTEEERAAVQQISAEHDLSENT